MPCAQGRSNIRQQVLYQPDASGVVGTVTAFACGCFWYAFGHLTNKALVANDFTSILFLKIDLGLLFRNSPGGIQMSPIPGLFWGLSSKQKALFQSNRGAKQQGITASRKSEIGLL